MVMLPWLCFTIGVCEMGLLLHSSCETPFFTKTFVETFTSIPFCLTYGWRQWADVCLYLPFSSKIPTVGYGSKRSRTLWQ
jgi:hypothetical protein